MVDQSIEKYEMSIMVKPEDIDLLGHVNNVVYLKWVQDIALAHWLDIATEEERKGFFWVVARHEVDYKRPTFKHDSVIAATWVGKKMGNLFERYTELRRGSDQKVLAEIRSLWCPVDSGSMRPVSLGDEMIKKVTAPVD